MQVKNRHYVSTRSTHWITGVFRQMTYFRRAIYKQASIANFDLGFDFEENEERDQFGSSTSEDQSKLMQERNRESTARATRGMVKILTDYLAEKKMTPLPDLTDDELPDILYQFYTNLRKAKGREYKLQSLKCIRAGLNRYMKEQRNLDIIKDLCFTRTNEMFKAVTVKAKKSGLGSTKSNPPIEPDDMAKLAAHFDHDIMNNPNPRLLQKAVLFNIIFFFCHRGRQNIYTFTQDIFDIATDPDGTQYVYQAVDEMDKNHGVEEKLPANDGRMYEQKGTPFINLL